MRKGIFALSILSILISNSTNAEYVIKIPLEQQIISFESAEVTGTIELQPNTINRGDTSNIKWDFTYADSITIEDIGRFQNKNGSISVSPITSRSYNVDITNGDKSHNEILNLTVIQPNQEIYFMANPTRIGVGQSSRLTWDVSNAYGVKITNINDNNLPLNGFREVYPTSSTSYTLTATGYEGVADKQETINIEVIPNAVISSFETDKNKITTGDSVIFSWNVSNAESLALNPFGPLVQRVSGTQSIPFNTAGTFVYTLEATSLSGVKDQKSKTINVFDPATITSFKVNGQDSIDVSPNADLNFTWNTTSAPTLKLNGTTVSGTSQTLAANTQVGSTTYTLQATNAADDSVTDNVIVNVVGDAVINTFTAPTAVFANSTFNLNWTATGANRYTLKSNNNSSGVTTTEENLNTLLTKVVTPTSSGSFTYTLSAYNTANSSVTRDVSVNIENDPTFTDFKVNGQNSINVSPSASLSFTGEGFSTGATLQGRDSTNATDAGLPSTASVTAGTTTYYAAAEKTVNSTTRYSGLRSVIVNVVENWVSIEPTYTNWVNNGGVYSCTAWFPAASTVTINQSFTQTRSCSQSQTRSRQDREQEQYTKEIRNLGIPVTETQVITVSQSQAEKGTKETWVTATPTYTSWVNSDSIYGCENWSPATSTVNSGVSFTQTATDCEQNQTITRQNREQETTTLTYRNVGSPVSEQRTLTSQISTITATGTKVVAPDCRFVKYTSNDSYIRVKDPDVGVDELRLYWDGVKLYDGKKSDFKYSSLAQIYYYDPNNPLYESSALGVEDFEVCKRP